LSKKLSEEKQLMTFNEALKIELEAIEVALAQMSIQYGNPMLKPFNVFSKASAEDKINMRIDEILSRIARGCPENDENILLDLICYLVLKRVLRRLQHMEDV